MRELLARVVEAHGGLAR
ncbi:hypothetical protein RSK60_1950017 [Ralstonia solanacearum K60]|nr:hypothetical protein RSK60_1950017 [Ralstonia solanacearum K60]